MVWKMENNIGFIAHKSTIKQWLKESNRQDRTGARARKPDGKSLPKLQHTHTELFVLEIKVPR